MKAFTDTRLMLPFVMGRILNCYESDKRLELLAIYVVSSMGLACAKLR